MNGGLVIALHHSSPGTSRGGLQRHRPDPAGPGTILAMTDPTPKLYHYRAVFRSAYDGDTVTADIDLGMHTWLRSQKLRLLGINAPELRGDTHEAATRTRDRLISLCSNAQLVIETAKDQTEKYGRWLARLWVQGAHGRWRCINDLLVAEGLAVPYNP